MVSMAPTGRAISYPFVTLLAILSPMVPTVAEPASSRAPGPRFEVRLAGAAAAHPGVPAAWPRGARLLVVLGAPGSIEPRRSIGQTGVNAPLVLGRDVSNLGPADAAIVDARTACFPLDSLTDLKPGSYAVQAVLHTNPDLNFPNAPGDAFSPVVTARIGPPTEETVVKLELSLAEPAEAAPRESDLVKFVKIRSAHLSDFHGRPIYLRAGVILPRDFARQPDRHYPVRIHTGGYGARFTNVLDMMAPGQNFERAWMAADAPPMILVHLDGAGPLGDPYQVDSPNHGPYGLALTHELIPAIEARFRGIGRGAARVLDGGSTGGWVALALQIFYPDFFNGAWAFCPDSVDFRSFQLVNIYDDANAYVNAHGFERPAAREISGDVRYTMRHECRLENVLGLGDSWTLSGLQWGAWNATYGPRGQGGHPLPLWNPTTGAIDHQAAEHWKRYDLRRVLEESWPVLGPKLQGKLHIWIGEADDYFLNNAVHRLDSFLRDAHPAYQGSITYGPGQGHCWMGISQRELMKQMARRVETAHLPQAPAAGD